ncbi:glycosyl hydrolase family protein [bacterium]|nr:MAG: glycosyl hydrolase family protein [bacterium]
MGIIPGCFMFALKSSLSRASFAISSVLLGSALLVSGCGGGGGGATVPTATPIPSTTPTATPLPSVFSDEFNSGSLDRSKWTTLTTTSSLQRTQFGNQPRFAQDSDGTRYMRLPLDTYVPDAAVRQAGVLQMYGTEVAANQKITRGTGIAFEARTRLSNPERGGLITSFFMFGQKGNFNGTPPLTFDEIDHEVLTNGLLATPPYTWTNSYNDFIIPQTGYPSGDSYFDSTKTIALPEPFTTGYSAGNWNVYRVEWKPGQVQWFINNQLIRTETSGVVPDDSLGVRFNIWAAQAPPLGWEAAYDATLTPAQTSSANQTYTLDVDWVRVRTLASTTGTVRSTSSSRLVPLSSAEIVRGLSGPGYQSKGK